jgi:hypothetical protein
MIPLSFHAGNIIPGGRRQKRQCCAAALRITHGYCNRSLTAGYSALMECGVASLKPEVREASVVFHAGFGHDRLPALGLFADEG